MAQPDSLTLRLTDEVLFEAYYAYDNNLVRDDTLVVAAEAMRAVLVAALGPLVEELQTARLQLKGVKNGADWTNHHNAVACPYCNPDRLQFAAAPLVSPPGERPDEILLKARKLLEALAEPCTEPDEDNSHEWRNCRRCMAVRQFDFHGGETRILVARILSALGVHREVLIETPTCWVCRNEPFGPASERCARHAEFAARRRAELRQEAWCAAETRAQATPVEAPPSAPPPAEAKRVMVIGDDSKARLVEALSRAAEAPAETPGPECWCGRDEALARGDKSGARYDIVCPKHDGLFTTEPAPRSEG